MEYENIADVSSLFWKTLALVILRYLKGDGRNIASPIYDSKFVFF